MSIKLQIDAESELARVSCPGTLDAADARLAVKALWEAPGWEGKSSIWDFRETKFKMSSAEIQLIAQFILSNQPETAPLKVAFVTAGETDFGLAHRFGDYREDPQTEFRVFRNYKEALAWARDLESTRGTCSEAANQDEPKGFLRSL
jgi:hypothetical protein